MQDLLGECRPHTPCAAAPHTECADYKWAAVAAGSGLNVLFIGKIELRVPFFRLMPAARLYLPLRQLLPLAGLEEPPAQHVVHEHKSGYSGHPTG